MKNRTLILPVLFTVVLTTGCANANTNERKIVNEVNDTSLAELTIYAFDGKTARIFALPNFGHAFVSIKNLQTEPIVVGKATLQPNEEMFIATWGQQIYKGVWYNLEPLYFKDGRYDGHVSVKRGINDVHDFDLLTTYIENNDKWALNLNCTNFAVGLWNSIANDDILKPASLIPGKLADEITRFDTYVFNKPVENLESFTKAAHYNGRELAYYEFVEENF